MSSVEAFDPDLRASIINNPSVLLEDEDVMRALVEANGNDGKNVVDLRSVAMRRLETRLDDLETRHQSVISAAYDNLISTNRIHRALSELLAAESIAEFLHSLGHEAPDVLHIDALRLIFETDDPEEGEALAHLGDFIVIERPGFSENYIHKNQHSHRKRPVVLRQIASAEDGPFGEKGYDLRSEALIRLDLGDDNLPILLLMGSEDPSKFHPQHGTDLLAFFGSVLQHALRTWLN